MHNQEIPYGVPYNKIQEKEITKFFEYMPRPSVKDGNYQVQGKTEIQHEPTKLNYWHVEYLIIDYKNNPIKYGKSEYIKNFCRKVLTDIICANSSNELPSFEPISSRYYKN